MFKLLTSILIVTNAFSFIPEKFRMNYIQEFKSLVSRDNRTAKGVFEYKFPSNLRINQDTPEKMIYVSNKNKTWLYRAPLFDDEPGEVTVTTGQDTGLSTFFDILKNGLTSNAYYQVQDKNHEAVLIFNNSAIKKTGIKMAKLQFKKDKQFENTEKMFITYEDGREVTMTLSNIDKEAKFEKDNFLFIPPKGSKIN